MRIEERINKMVEIFKYGKYKVSSKIKLSIEELMIEIISSCFLISRIL